LSSKFVKSHEEEDKDEIEKPRISIPIVAESFTNSSHSKKHEDDNEFSGEILVLFAVIKETDGDDLSKSGYDTSENPFVKV
jgi:hypothetical protein